jgi:glutamine cyclotransferase
MDRSPTFTRRRLLAALGAAPVSAALPSVVQLGAPTRGYRVVASYPHDARAFTQGLIYRDGFLYESTGQYGQSTLRKVRVETGEVVQQHRLAPELFAEGLTEWQGRLIQLTWQSGLGFVYERESFKTLSTFRYGGEGWGLAHDGKRLILSDGSDVLRFLNPTTFAEIGRVRVRDGGRPIVNLNELEFVRSEIWANVWHDNRVARIDPASGLVTGWIDFAGLLPRTLKLDPEAVLNGIAFDVARNRLFVTGKLWPRVFEVAVG